jgi:hypothetical protein
LIGVEAPIGLTPEESLAYQEEMRKHLNAMIPGAISSVEANVATDPRAPGMEHIPFAGVWEGLPALAGTAYEFARNKINAGLGTNLPPQWQITKDAAQHLKTTEDIYYKELGGEEGPAYEGSRIAGSVMGNAVPILPGGLIAKLPLAARIPAQLAVPTTEGAVANLAIGSTLGAGLDALHSSNTPAFADQVSSLVNGPATPAPAQPQEPRPPATTGLVPGVDALVNGGQQPGMPPAPTFNEQGESGWSVGGVLGGVAAGILTLAALKYTHGLGSEITTAARDLRLRDPAYAQAAQDFNNARIAQGGQISPTEPGALNAPTPSGGAVHDAAVAAQTSVLDANAQARDYIKLTSDNPAAADKLANQVGLTLNDQAWQARLRSFLTTGIDDQTGRRVTSPKRWFDDVAALPDPQKKILDDGLHAANELDNRAYNRRMASTPVEHDFPHLSDQDLARSVAAVQSDPVLKNLMDRHGQLGRDMIDLGQQRGFFTPTEAADILQAHPNHVAEVDNTGRVLHAMGPREYGIGVTQANTTAWSALAQHLEVLYRQFELNEMRGGFVDHMMNVQAGAPYSAQMIEKIANPYARANSPTHTLYPTVQPMSTGVREPVLAVRRGTGIDYYKIYHPAFYDMLSGNNATKLRAYMDGLSVPRRLLSSGTTGVGSVLSGRVFPLTNAFRTAVQLGINRAPGRSGGLIDKGVQRLSGGRFGYRGPDPTTPLGMAYSGARSGFDDLALHVAPWFDKDNQNPVTQLLKSILTSHVMDNINQGLMDYYGRTATFRMRARGVGGQGSPYQTQLPALYRKGGQREAPIRLLSGQLTPSLFMNGGKLGTIKPFLIHLQNAVNEVFSSISDVGHEYHYRLNEGGGRDPHTVAYETRALTGDPGVAGAGTAANVVRSAVPYANVSTQGLARMGRALKETPVGTGVALATTLGSAAMLSLLTSMRNDQTRDHLQNTISTQSRAANWILYGHDNPSLSTMFSFPQELRPVYGMMLDIISKALNVGALHHDDAAHDGVYGFLKDWFSQHIENSTMRSAQHGLADMFNVVDVPAAFNAVAGLTGSTVRIDLDRIADDLQHGRFGASTFVMPVGADGPLPNHPPGDGALEGADGKKFVAMMSNIFGITGGMIDHLFGFERYNKMSGDIWGSLGQVGKDWIQRAMDLNPGLNNILWENPVRDSMRSPVVERAETTLNKMKDTAGANSAERMEGTTGGKFPLPVTPQVGPGKVPIDPQMRNMYLATAAEYSFIQSHFMPGITALKKQMADAAQQPKDNRDRREWMNTQTRTITDKWRYVQSRIDDLNAAFSRQVGAPVDVGHIDWEKGTEQFQ